MVRGKGSGKFSSTAPGIESVKYPALPNEAFEKPFYNLILFN